MKDTNFASLLAGRCSSSSRLINADSDNTVGDNGLGSEIAKSASFFSGAGLKPNDRIIIGCTISSQTALAYLGSIYAGLIPVPIDLPQLESDFDHYRALTGSKGLWSEKEVPGILSKCERNFLVLKGSPSTGQTEIPPAARSLDDIAVLVGTSGTIGKPRFVMVTHGNLMANTEAIVRSQKLGGNESAMLILPLSYCFGASVLHSHLMCGGSVVFDSRFMFPDKVLNAVARFKCTTFAGVPSVYKILLNRSHLGSIPMPDLKRFLQAGGPLDSDSIDLVKKRLPVDFYVMYGQTEATARITCLDPSMYEKKKGSVGKPLENIKIRISSRDGTILSTDQAGLLQVYGPSVCQGYYSDPEETARKFSDGWLDTQDIARIDADGYVWIEGREGEFLKIRGKRVTFNEIEQKVRIVSGVADAAAVAVKHAEADEAPFIFFVPRIGADKDVVARAIRDILPPVWTCQGIVPVEELPLTDRGKINRSRLSEMVKELNG